MEALKIWLLTLGATMAYGVAHDQVTARVSIEYFTVGHTPIFPTEDPTLTALTWGIVATWYVGALAGLLFAFVARFGSAPKLGVRDLLRPGGVLIACVAWLVVLSGMAGYVAAELGHVSLGGRYTIDVPADGHSRFIADAFAHRAAYVAGFVGSIVLAVWIWLRRTSAARAAVPSSAREAGRELVSTT